MVYVKPGIEIQNNFDNVGCRRFGLVQVVGGSLCFQNQEDYDDFGRVLEALRRKYLFTKSTEATIGQIAHEATNLLRSFGIEGVTARVSRRIMVPTCTGHIKTEAGEVYAWSRGAVLDHSSLDITWIQES